MADRANSDDFIHKWKEPACLYFTAAEHHRTLAVLISPPAEGRGLSWPGWLVTYRCGMPARRRSPITVLTGLDYNNFDDRSNDVTATPNRHTDI